MRGRFGRLVTKFSKPAIVLIGSVTVLIASMPSLAATKGKRCRPQRPQTFLERSSYVKRGAIVADAHLKAIRYRVVNYGSIADMGQESINKESAASMAIATEFFGHAVRLNRRIVPALQCVEERISRRCTDPKDSYTPKAIGGLRTSNTIRGGEISNHLFGIAIDIDPYKNPCCHCVGEWKRDPKCASAAKTPFERAALTRCWVDAFEHYGFYWLGRDTLEDTMHFEFLGNPQHIYK
jgi:hypothetical protein